MIASLGGTSEEGAEWASLLSAVGQLWVNGVGLDWGSFYRQERRCRTPLPTYPFERRSYWLDPVPEQVVQAALDSQHSVAANASGRSSDRVVGQDSGSADVDAGVGQGSSDADEIMTVLSAVLQETLGIKLDSRAEDIPFVALGADSLLLMQLARVVQTQLGLAISFRQLVEQYATPRLLVEAVRATRKLASTQVDAPSAQPRTAGSVLPTLQTTVSLPEPARKVRVVPSFATSQIKGARIGRDELGQRAWFLPEPNRPGKYLKIERQG